MIRVVNAMLIREKRVYKVVQITMMVMMTMIMMLIYDCILYAIGPLL